MPELLDLPVFILRMIAERCEFRPRLNLRSTSRLMKEVVDQSKFALHYVGLHIRDSRSLQIFIEYRNRDGNLTSHKIEMGIGNSYSMETTSKGMGSIFKNAETGYFSIWSKDSEDRDMMEDFFQKVKENSKSPLKSREICCQSQVDPFWIFDKLHCQRLNSHHDDPNFFHEHSDTLMNLDEVRLIATMNITDEDVLSMKATTITLKSENFSAEMVNKLVEKFIARGLIDSYFYIENPKGNFIPEIKIPDGFIASTVIRGLYDKIDGDEMMKLSVEKDIVLFTIIRLLNDVNNE